MELNEDPKRGIKQKLKNPGYSFQECIKCKNAFDISSILHLCTIQDFYCPTCLAKLPSKATELLDKFYQWLYIDTKIVDWEQVKGVLNSVYNTLIYQPTIEALYAAIEYYFEGKVPNTLQLAELLEYLAQLQDLPKEDEKNASNTEE